MWSVYAAPATITPKKKEHKNHILVEMRISVLFCLPSYFIQEQPFRRKSTILSCLSGLKDRVKVDNHTPEHQHISQLPASRKITKVFPPVETQDSRAKRSVTPLN